MERSDTAAQPEVRLQLAHLLDPGSFVEIDAIAEHDCEYFGMRGRKEEGDGLVSGTGLVNGRRIVVYAHDARFLAGSSGKMHAHKIVKAIDLALKIGCPIVALNNSSGIRIHEGIDAGVHFGEVFFKTVKASGVVPQISVILGDCAGGAAYTPSLTDFVIMTEERGNMFLTGPAVIKAATGEDVTKEQIGGGRMHAEITGLSQFLVPSSIEALHLARELLGFLPQNNREAPDRRRADVTSNASNVEQLIPVDPHSPFDATDVIRAVVDDSDFLEVHQLFARNVVVGFARIAGMPIGIVAN
ncbi:acyl-CoA carboxylase subunit beta [Bradyrhizobium sp. BR 1433]|uniref:acyl-CoA carboxylase subunit beta n=1 Tax=Bradyrhizobium sp. BR 1433 TaxID=3447967 RepID=UPI003EE4E1AD